MPKGLAPLLRPLIKNNLLFSLIEHHRHELLIKFKATQVNKLLPVLTADIHALQVYVLVLVFGCVVNGDGEKLRLIEGFLLEDIFSELDVYFDAFPIRYNQEVEEIELSTFEP